MTTTSPHHAHELTVAMGDLQRAHNSLGRQLRRLASPPTADQLQALAETRASGQQAVQATRNAPGFNAGYQHLIDRYEAMDARAAALAPDAIDPATAIRAARERLQVAQAPRLRPYAWRPPTVAEEHDPACTFAVAQLVDPHGTVVETIDGATDEVADRVAAYVRAMAADSYPCSVILEPAPTSTEAEAEPELEPAADWQPDYSPWRHGGWYVHNVRYPTGAVGCVSRNYRDGKWRIVCDERPGSYPGGPNDHTYRSRDDAARAEWALAKEATIAAQVAAAARAATGDGT